MLNFDTIVNYCLENHISMTIEAHPNKPSMLVFTKPGPQSYGSIAKVIPEERIREDLTDDLLNNLDHFWNDQGCFRHEN